MNLALISLLIINIATVSSQKNPSISYVTREQVVNIGGEVNLDCSVQYAEDYPILWTRINPSISDDSLPLSSGCSMIIRDSRFTSRCDHNTNTYTLQIKNIQESDAGNYQCQVVITSTNKITADVNVLVRIPPIISDNSSRSAVVLEGQAVRLECYADGYPPSKIYWRRENNALLATGGSLFRGNVLAIVHVSKDDRGTYYCIADNGVGRGARRNINLEVQFAPVISIPRQRVGQALLYDADLNCHVEAYPPPAISWIRDGATLANNQHYQISSFATADEYTDSTLRALSVEKKQYGLYTCRGANKFGISEKTVELFETVVPVCPPACGESKQSG